MRVALIEDVIEARQEKGITQQQLKAMAGLKRPVISRLERMEGNPTFSTVFKVLDALGKRFVIAPLDNGEQQPA